MLSLLANAAGAFAEPSGSPSPSPRESPVSQLSTDCPCSTPGQSGGVATTIGDWPTANVALVVSAIAATVAIIAVIYTMRTFRRAGARVSVRLRQRRWLFNDIGGEPLLLDVVSVDVINSGLASIQISEITWETKTKESFAISPDLGPESDTPRTLSGLSADLTGYRMDRLVAGAQASAEGKKVRAVVLLGGTRTEKSEWISVGG